MPSNVTVVEIRNRTTVELITEYITVMSLLEDEYSDQKQVRIYLGEGVWNSTTESVVFSNSKAVIKMLDVGSEVSTEGSGAFKAEYKVNSTLEFLNGSSPIQYDQLGYAEIKESELNLVLSLRAARPPWIHNHTDGELPTSQDKGDHETIEVKCTFQLIDKKSGYSKFLFLWVSFCVSLLSIECLRTVAVQAREPNVALSISNYLVFMMVGFDIFWCFTYFTFTFYLGNAYLSYCLFLVVLHLIKILRGNLLLYQIVMKAFFDKYSSQDVGSMSNRPPMSSRFEFSCTT